MTSAFRGTVEIVRSLLLCLNAGRDVTLSVLDVNLFLLVAAFAGGALNGVAGGGSFIALPALIFAGIPAVSANATNTLALWPASLASAWAYRRELTAARSWAVSLSAVSFVGGLLGGLLLLRTTDTSFLRLLPWLLLIAAVTFTFGDRIQKVARRDADPLAGHAADKAPLFVLALQLVIAIYGGYFGGGMGIMMLAALQIAGMRNIHEMNAVKALLGVIINGVALAEFIALGAIAWAPGLVMIVGGVAGGYVGAATARRADQTYVRALVTVVAWSMTIYFFFR
jgi:uncharacterized membrane protein YfcA